MYSVRNLMALAAAVSGCSVYAQTPVPAQPPVAPPPPTVALRAPQPAPGIGRFMAPMGMQARYTYEVIRTNKADLKVTDAQMQTIDAARTAAEKLVNDRAQVRNGLRNEIQTIADAETPDMAKLEAKVQEMMKIQGEDMMADYRLTAAYKKALTAAQREKMKTMSPKFEPMMPMMNRPGMLGSPAVPGNPAGQPPIVPPAPPVVAPPPPPPPPQ